MPISGTFGGFPFDPEVYQGFVDQEATFSDSILASGILARDQSLATSLDNGGVQGTIRFYNPLDPDKDAPLVRDGETDNVPTEVSGGKQRCNGTAEGIAENNKFKVCLYGRIFNCDIGQRAGQKELVRVFSVAFYKIIHGNLTVVLVVEYSALFYCRTCQEPKWFAGKILSRLPCISATKIVCKYLLLEII